MVEPIVLRVRFPYGALISMNKFKDKKLARQHDRLARIARRKKRKGENNNRNYDRRRDDNAPICNDCGKQQSWCGLCRVYSKTCCIPYGTCACS